MKFHDAKPEVDVHLILRDGGDLFCKIAKDCSQPGDRKDMGACTLEVDRNAISFELCRSCTREGEGGSAYDTAQL